LANAITRIGLRSVFTVTSLASPLVMALPDHSNVFINNRQSAQTLYIRLFQSGDVGYMDGVYYYDMAIPAGGAGLVNVSAGIEVWALVASDTPENVEVTITDGEPLAGYLWLIQ
jgi:hypothetical protein